MKNLAEYNKPATWYIVRKAMEMTLKEVRLPKCIRDGTVKTMKYIITLLIFISSCTSEMRLVQPKPIYYTTDKKSIEYGTHIGYTENKEYIILTEQGWKMHLHDSLIIKE